MSYRDKFTGKISLQEIPCREIPVDKLSATASSFLNCRY
jgi:hypothetical protein